MKQFLLFAMLILSVSCSKPQEDRIVTGDGNNITGTITEMTDGKAFFGTNMTVPLPEGAARVYLRNGASFRGAVSMEDGILYIQSSGGGFSCTFHSASVIVWGADHAGNMILDIPAGTGWLNTHLEVETGAFLTLSAGGVVTMETGTSGPEGINEFSTSAALVPEATNGELVMRIGEDSEAVVVGTEWSGNVTRSGELYLAVNIPEEGISEASGFFTVSITLGEEIGRGTVAIYPALK